MGQTFAAAVEDWVRETPEYALAVLKGAAEDFVEEVARRTPVDTGYLKSSLTAQIGAPVPIEPLRGKADVSSPATLVIDGWDGDQALFVTFTASYASYVEFGTSKMAPRAMVRLSAQQWPQMIARHVAALRAKIGRPT